MRFSPWYQQRTNSANKTYKTGDTLGFVLNFSEPVFLNIKTDTL